MDKNYFMSRLANGESMDTIGAEIAAMMNEAAYASNSRMEENIVKNISLNEEKEKADGSFAQVSKVVVGVGVLICIGMVGFLLLFLVKNSRK